jgi:essential nuclear protein 1
LADLITAKLEAHENRVQFKDEPNEPRRPPLPPKVIEVYKKLSPLMLILTTRVGILLSRYKSGKLPKAFKIIPSTYNWEAILQLTSPENWTPHATYEATRLFVSNLDSNQAQRYAGSPIVTDHRFINDILLDKVRDDIAENQKLNYHLYMAVKKSLYKPGAFFKGFLFPLCQVPLS